MAEDEPGRPDLLEQDPEQLYHCVECGALCDHRVQVCECDPAICPLPPVQ
jgi:hypothetical protein